MIETGPAHLCCIWTTATALSCASPASTDGFTSVMIDASSKPFEENIALTRQVVEYAHDHGVVVEAELGTPGRHRGRRQRVRRGFLLYPPRGGGGVCRPRPACDSLAIAIGTSHGAYKFKPGTKPQLRFDMLEEVARRLPGFPIVLHGASSVSPGVWWTMVNQYGGKMPGAIGVPEDHAAQGRVAWPCARSTSTPTCVWP